MQAQRLKDATKAVLTTDATEPYVKEVRSLCMNKNFLRYNMFGLNLPFRRQLRYLHDVIDPVDMCLTGGGFFRLKKSLLVSVSIF